MASHPSMTLEMVIFIINYNYHHFSNLVLLETGNLSLAPTVGAVRLQFALSKLTSDFAV